CDAAARTATKGTPMRLSSFAAGLAALLAPAVGLAQPAPLPARYNWTYSYLDSADQGLRIGGNNFLIGKGAAGGYLVKAGDLFNPVSTLLIGAQDTRMNSMSDDGVGVIFAGGD